MDFSGKTEVVQPMVFVGRLLEQSKFDPSRWTFLEKLKSFSQWYLSTGCLSNQNSIRQICPNQLWGIHHHSTTDEFCRGKQKCLGFVLGLGNFEAHKKVSLCNKVWVERRSQITCKFSFSFLCHPISCPCHLNLFWAYVSSGCRLPPISHQHAPRMSGPDRLEVV